MRWNNRVVNLFTKGSHHWNLSVIHIVLNLFHQGKGNRNIGLNSHYLVIFSNLRDKLQIFTLAKQMYPGETAWFIKQYEEAVRRPFFYLFVDLKPTTQDSCRLRTNVLPGEERFEQGEVQDNVSQALLGYLKQQTLMAPQIIPEVQRLEINMDNLLYRADIRDYDKARQYMQLQNRFLTYKHQLPTVPIPSRNYTNTTWTTGANSYHCSDQPRTNNASPHSRTTGNYAKWLQFKHRILDQGSVIYSMDRETRLVRYLLYLFILK